MRNFGRKRYYGRKNRKFTTEYDDGSDIAELMRIFKENEGSEKMCDLVENYAKEYAEEAVKQAEKDNALRLFQNGVDYGLVRASITSLSDEELQKIYQEAKNG